MTISYRNHSTDRKWSSAPGYLSHCCLILCCVLWTAEVTVAAYSDDHTPNMCKIFTDLVGEVMDCRGQGLTKVPTTWIPATISELYLDNNHIAVLPDNAFGQLSRLKVLTISINDLNLIQACAFCGLRSLQVLNLEKNCLSFTDPMWGNQPFIHLPELQELRIKENKNGNHGGSYHKDLLAGIDKLKYLSLDTFYGSLQFGQVFDRMTSLDHLFLSGGLSVLKNNSFQNVSSLGLSSLSIADVDFLTTTQLNAFSYVSSIQSLYIFSTSQGVEQTLRSLYPFRNRSLNTLYLHDISMSQFIGGASKCSDGVLDAFKTEFLSQICVENFSLSNSGIFVIQSNTITGPVWQSCLKTLDLTKNPLIGDRIALLQLQRLRNLKTLRLSSSLYSEAPSNILKLTERFRYQRSLLPGGRKSSIVVGFPKSLEIAHVESLSGNSGSLSYDVTIRGGENVREIYMCDNGISEFTGSISGLTRLEICDMSYNDCSNMSPTFFEFTPTISSLTMRGVQLDSDFMSKQSERLFRPLTNLKLLDLSSNNLGLFSSNSLRNNSKLHYLNLAKNRFTSIPFDLTFLPNLSHLDIRLNSIAKLDPKEMKMIDDQSLKVPEFSLSLSGNVMVCGCSSLQFLSWLQKTKTVLDNPSNYSCISEDGRLTTIADKSDIKAIWRECQGKYFLLISIVLLSLMSLGFVITISCVKQQTRIKSFVYRVVLGRFSMRTPADYKYGVFIGYADADTRLACFTLRDFIQSELSLSTYARDINLLPASDIAESIVDAVNTSWRIVLIVTAEYLDNDLWSYFTMKTASYMVSPANPGLIVLLVDEETQHRLPASLLRAVEEESIVSMSPRHTLGYEQKQRLCHLILNPRS